MELTITIYEDNLKEISVLKEHINEWNIHKRHILNINAYTSWEEKSDFDSDIFPDLFIFDIQLSGVNGMEAARQLRAYGYQGYIIFLTSFREFVFQGYEVRALNFLLKPVQKEALFLCLNDIVEELSCCNYTFNGNKIVQSIPYKDILCFSTCFHNIEILSTSGVYSHYGSLNRIIEMLPEYFLRVHRGYIVNMKHIRIFTKNQITLSNGSVVSIGRSYASSAYNLYTDYVQRLDETWH